MNTGATSLNDRFREEFILDLPARFQRMGQLIEGLEKQDNPHDSLAELFRATHSIKGSSSTFGLQILSSICHPFEELIQAATETGAAPKEFISLALDYLDLLREAADAIAEKIDHFDKTEKKLAALHNKVFRHRFSVAVAVNSRMLREICRQAAKSLDARLVEFDDSLGALQRVLTEPFNVVIVSSEMYPMRGESLVAALNLSHCRGQGLKTVLLSSDEEKAGYVNRGVDPDYVVMRDKDFIPTLSSILSYIHRQSGDKLK